jgi:F0F1-type ATP synthase assembly protein I
MTVTIPLVFIAGVIVWLAYRYMGLRVWQAIVCLIFGFLLAATSAAPEIRDLLTGLAQWLTKP